MRFKARLVADGHLTQPVKDSSYSGVISLRTMRIALLVGELNGLQAMVGDVGNAYLEAHTKEKVYFIAGPEFAELEGCVMIVSKALYGLRTSGARFHDRLADVLREMGFTPCKMDGDLWMRDAGGHYEFVCVYVDDLLAIMKNPQEFFDKLKKEYNFKLKGVGPPEYHLGGNFGRDKDGTLFWGSRTYVEKVIASFERMFGELPKKSSAPMDKEDSPELDTSELLDVEGIKKYMSLMGALQWCVTLGRMDIMIAVVSLSRFRLEPRKGHMERVKRVFGYLRRFPDAALRFRTGIPNLESVVNMDEYDWMYSVYGDVKEQLPSDMPIPKGKRIRVWAMVDANLMFCKVTGKSCTGVTYFLNQTLVDWFCKKQDTVETATYGSEFVAAKQATEGIISLRALLMYMGVPMEEKAWLLGDNKSIITSSTIPHSQLSKRHNALAYHKVRASVAAGFLKFCWINGKQNLADVLTKYLPYSVFRPLVEPILFWKGETQVEDKEDKD